MQNQRTLYQLLDSDWDRPLSRKKLTKPQDLPYRPCVGMLVFNPRGEVWVGRRSPKWRGPYDAPIWQMPQGGIEPGEAPLHAAIRELEEETCMINVQVVGEIADWLSYDLPPELLGIALKGKFRGQRQRWFALRFTGPDSEIDISGQVGHKAEFEAWRWAGIGELPEFAVPFKRPVYERVVAEFTPLIGGLQSAA